MYAYVHTSALASSSSSLPSSLLLLPLLLLIINLILLFRRLEAAGAAGKRPCRPEDASSSTRPVVVALPKAHRDIDIDIDIDDFLLLLLMLRLAGAVGAEKENALHEGIAIACKQQRTSDGNANAARRR